MKIILIFLSLILFSFYFTGQVLAVTTTSITSSPSSVTQDTSFDIQAEISGDSNTSYYLKARVGVNTSSLTKGYTKNSNNSTPDDWLGDTDSWSKFPTATTDSTGVWQGSITVKVATTSTIGNNLLILRIRPAGGSNNTDSSDVTISIDPVPTSTPTPTPTPTSIPTNTPVPGPTNTPTSTHTPTPTKTPTPTPTKTPTPTSTIKPTAKPSPTLTLSSSNNSKTAGPNLPASILGTSSATIFPTISQNSVKDQNPESPLTKIFFIGGGIILLLAGGLFYTFLAKRKSNLS